MPQLAGQQKTLAAVGVERNKEMMPRHFLALLGARSQAALYVGFVYDRLASVWLIARLPAALARKLAV